MKIVCSSSMPFVEEAFSSLGDTVVLPGRSISAEDVRDADILAIRSTTEVNADLLENSSVRFVGTATIGFNHIDTDLLADRGISWCAAPGCNANSVAEYVTSALLSLSVRHDIDLSRKTMGVIGVGNVGARVVQKARALGMQVLQNDPPRARAEGDGGFVGLEDLLANADVVTLHVPLTKEGSDPTYHLVNNAFLARLQNGTILINSSRGSVACNDSLVKAIDGRTVEHAVIDTWEGEPAYSMDLLERVAIGTPHIAGYSFEGKVTGTLMVYEKACEFLGIKPQWTPGPLMPPPAVPELNINAAGRADNQILWEIVKSIYDVETDDTAMRGTADPDPESRSAGFDSLRVNYPVRREFPSTLVKIEGGSPALADTVASLGFRTSLRPPADNGPVTQTTTQ